MKRVKLSALLLIAFELYFFSLPIDMVAMDSTPVNNLIGQTITKPVAVQGEQTTFVVGNTFVNGTTILQRNKENSTMVDIQTPVWGNRIIFHGNRVINNGMIIQKGGTGSATMTTIEKAPGRSTLIESSQNLSINRGIIQKYQ